MTSISNFNPLDFGTVGQRDVLAMQKNLEKEHLALNYDSSTHRFTILNSRSYTHEAIDRIIHYTKYFAFRPEIAGADPHGNHVIKLESSSSYSAESDEYEDFDDYRRQISQGYLMVGLPDPEGNETVTIKIA